MQKGTYSRVVIGPLDTNSYIINVNNKHIIVDPGSNEYLKIIKSENLNPVAVLLTHCHGDHSMGINNIQKKYDIPVYISEDEWDFFNMGGSFSEFLNVPEVKIANKYILKGDSGSFIIEDETFNYEIFPGHTPGSTIFQMDNIIFSGDLIFNTSIGRSDLFGGDIYEMKESLKRFVRKYKDYHICPGHLDEFSMKDMIKTNNILREVIND